MSEWMAAVEAWFIAGTWIKLVQAALILLGGILLGRLLGAGAVRLLRERLDKHASTILRRAVFYLVLGLAVASALSQLGFKLGVLLGAAGVVSVALGFASQTSVSNLISGLFLVGERPFGIGDVIRVGPTTGEILSIDLLSVKLRTFDNLLVRIPNETLIKTEVINLSRFPIRRADILVGIAYKEDIGRVRDLLMEVAAANPLCLEEPKPVFIVVGFGASSVDLQFSVWAKRENFLDVKNALYQDIKRAFDAAGVEIPFPHVSLYAGSATQAIPVRLAEPGANDQA